MKRITFFLIAFFALLSLSIAQENDDRENQAFRFIYIVHDPSTPVDKLIEILYDVETRTIENGQKCMICLSNGIGTKNTEEYLLATILEGSDYLPAFEKLREELRKKRAHDIDISRDIDYIIDIFNREHDFLDESGELYYESMTFDFYLSSQFCDNGYAADFIVPLYLAFDVPNMPNQFNFNVWVGADDIEKYDAKRIFGEKNYNNINEYILVMGY